MKEWGQLIVAKYLDNCWWKYWDTTCPCLVWRTHSWSLFKHFR